MSKKSHTFRKLDGGKLRRNMDLKLTEVAFKVLSIRPASCFVASASDSILLIEGIGLEGPLQGVKFAFAATKADKFEVARSPRLLWGVCLWFKATVEKLCYRA